MDTLIIKTFSSVGTWISYTVVLAFGGKKINLSGLENKSLCYFHTAPVLKQNIRLIKVISITELISAHIHTPTHTHTPAHKNAQT